MLCQSLQTWHAQVQEIDSLGGRSYSSTVPSFVPLYTVVPALAWSILAINVVISLEIALGIALVNLSGTGDSSSLTVCCRGLLFLMDWTDSSEASTLNTSASGAASAWVTRDNSSFAVCNSAVVSSNVAQAD